MDRRRDRGGRISAALAALLAVFAGCSSEETCINGDAGAPLCFEGAIDLNAVGEVFDIGDADGDGVDDLLVIEARNVPDEDLISVAFFDPAGGISVEVGEGTYATYGDVDQNGKQEVFTLADENTSRVYTLMNRVALDQGFFTHDKAGWSEVYRGPAGELLVALAGAYSDTLTLLELEQDFAYTVIDTLMFTETQELLLADMDGDGVTDLVNHVPYLTQLSVRNGASGVWTELLDFDRAQVFDLDADGRDELIEVRSGGVLGLDGEVLNRRDIVRASGGWLVRRFHADCPLFSTAIINHKTEVYLPDSTSSLMGKGDRQFSEEGFGEILAAGDLDGDGVCDLVVRLDEEMLAVRLGSRG